ncbi:uncharacterized protein [Amphiura filiformis]|uniref:uncharacterized protein n=1 Tax=Amphiura filiformis TaxID=82378 RepID=UPI003B22387A
MARHFIIPVLVILTWVALSDALRTSVNRAWAGGFQGIVEFPVAEAVNASGWHMKIDFDYNVFDFDASCWADLVEMHPEEGDKTRSLVILKNPYHTPTLEAGMFRFYFLAKTWKKRKGFQGDIEFFEGAYVPPPPPLPEIPE